MTLEECKQATTLLAFAEELEDVHNTAEEAFFAALARAIWQTEGVRPHITSTLLCHSQPFSSGEIQEDGYVKYDLSSFIPRFLGLTQPPMRLTEKGYQILKGDYLVENNATLYLPVKEEGCYRIYYRRTPQIITPETPLDTHLEMEEELCQALPLLVAHYLLLDEEPEKAQQYLTLYREQYALLRTTSVTCQGANYYSTNGW